MAWDERQIEDKKRLDASHADPAHWRGLFYFNPKDGRIFPPARYPGTGWTTNFANRQSVMALVAIILIPLIQVTLAVWLAGPHGLSHR